MKKTRLIMATIMAMVMAMSLQSCSDDDDINNLYDDVTHFANAIVTLKTNPADGRFYLQLDDSTTLLPINMTQSPFGDKELRALASIRTTTDAHEGYSQAAFVYQMDTIRTKGMSPDLGDQNAQTYKTDPVEIVNDWTTVAEDGYLTLRFRTYFGNGGIHTLRLVRNNDPTNPYSVTLYHDANGDTQGETGDGLIAFRLDDLPSTGGKTVDLTLRWMSFSGEKSVKFKYKSRE